jgi:uncharacterized protein (TIGR02145 family)
MKSIGFYVLLIAIDLIISCTKIKELATLSTNIASNPTVNSVTSGGNITNSGGADILARGVCWSTSQGPTISGSHTSEGTGSGSFISNIAGLTPGTIYYIRAYATNSVGTAYGNEVAFITDPVVLATISTLAVTGISPTTATSGGNISNNGGGDITERGVCWATTENPTISNSKTSDGAGSGLYNSSLTGLSEGEEYYVRSFATNNAGTAYGGQISFTTSISDVEGNIYRTVKIGPQIWMVDNLRTTKFTDNNPIPLITDQIEWNILTSPGYCLYDNDRLNGTIYGVLYNWNAVDTWKLCPTGWHVPSYNEWAVLRDFLADYSVAGGKLKSTGTIEKGDGLWFSPNDGATNETGFTALPAGVRLNNNFGFISLNRLGAWWGSDIVSSQTTAAYAMWLMSDYSDMTISFMRREDGLSVRCVKY